MINNIRVDFQNKTNDKNKIFSVYTESMGNYLSIDEKENLERIGFTFEEMSGSFYVSNEDEIFIQIDNLDQLKEFIKEFGSITIEQPKESEYCNIILLNY